MFVHRDCQTNPGDPGTKIRTGLGNQYGDLEVCLVDGVPHICVTCEVNGDYWRPCSQTLYDAILAEMQPGGNLAFDNNDPRWAEVDEYY